MLITAACVVPPRLLDECRARAWLDERLRHAHGPRCILHVDDRAVVLRLDLYGRVRRRGRCAADQQRQLEFLALHFRGHVNHLVE